MPLLVQGIRIEGTIVPRGAVSWDAEDFERRTARILRYVLGSAVGRVLRRHLIRTLTIIPPFELPFRFGAGTMATEVADSFPSGWDIGRCHPRVPEVQGVHGTGRGSDAYIYFQPGFGFDPSGGGRAVATQRVHADGVLLHELVHATRDMAGERTGRDRGLSLNYPNIEEFLAVHVTNMYHSERGRFLRRDYHRDGHAVYVRELRFARSREAWERRQIERIFSESPSLAIDLSRIPEASCRYNPFRGAIGPPICRTDPLFA